MFRTQHADLQATSQASDRSYATSADSPGASAAGTLTSHSSPLLCLADLQQVVMDIKSTLSAAISDVKTDIRAVASRLEHVEAAAMTHGADIQQVQRVTSIHAKHLMDMHRHMEDLNRGRRHNL